MKNLEAQARAVAAMVQRGPHHYEGPLRAAEQTLWELVRMRQNLLQAATHHQEPDLKLVADALLKLLDLPTGEEDLAP